MNPNLHPSLAPAGWLAEAFLTATLHLTTSAVRFSLYNRPTTGRSRTLRPGNETPLWNELIHLLRPHLEVYGRQAELGRVLGLPRQRIHSWLSRPTRQPDAERTLRLILWLASQPKIAEQKVSPNR